MNMRRMSRTTLRFISLATVVCGGLLLIFPAGVGRRSISGEPGTAAKHSHAKQDSEWLQAYGKLPLEF